MNNVNENYKEHYEVRCSVWIFSCGIREHYTHYNNLDEAKKYLRKMEGYKSKQVRREKEVEISKAEEKYFHKAMCVWDIYGIYKLTEEKIV
jgi:hypothetical protein